MEGYLMQLQPFSVNDGDGIRTTIFMAGCPLRCGWCSNPEGFDHSQKIAYYQMRCIGCGACTAVCPKQIGPNLNEAENREICVRCGACAKACPKGARKAMIEKKSVEEIVEEAKRHRLFYKKSGGGITFSGGEATSQTDFLDELSEKLYDEGLDLAIETCGLFDFERVKPILNRMEQIFIDIKHMDSATHKAFTGVGNETILENIKRLKDVRAEVIIRIPTIVGVNADEENIQKTVAFVKEFLPNAKMELLPYHTFGIGKYESMGIPYAENNWKTPTEEFMQKQIKDIFEAGIEYVDFR